MDEELYQTRQEVLTEEQKETLSNLIFLYEGQELEVKNEFKKYLRK